VHPEAQRLNALTDAIIGAAIEVHKTLGPGLLESAYEACLCHELMKRGLKFAAQIISYLKISGLHVGLVINFNVKNLIANSGVMRRVNNCPE